MSVLTGVEAKAVELVALGRVHEPIPDAKAVPVGSSDGARIYTVVIGLGGAFTSCTCKATGRCSHIIAAELGLRRAELERAAA